MLPAAIIQEDWAIDSKLSNFDVTRKELQAVVLAAVAARADFVPNHPANAAGLLSYIYGTKALRDLFCPKGWQINRTGNIESVYHPEKGLKIIFQNADSAADPMREPRAISEKGPAAAKAVELGQWSLFPEFEASEAEKSEVNASVWYFFVCAGRDEVTAELSSPKSIEDRQFHGFNERIFIVKAGEWVDVDVSDDQPAQDFEIQVTRKK